MRGLIESDIRGWDAISEHRTGTEGDAITAQWFADSIRQAGAEPHIDEFPFRRRVLHECSISAAGRSADGVPQFDGGVTGADGITAPLAPLGAGEVINLTKFDPGMSDATRALLAARKSSSAAAIVAVAAASTMVPGLALLNADKFDTPYGPPVLQVGSEHGAWLAEAVHAGSEARLVAHVTVEDTTACNVQTTVKGSVSGLAPLVIMTPRSAWWTCTAERAGGLAVWFACLRRFAAQPPHRDVIFTANTGHELGHTGLQHYLDSNPALLTGAHAWIHLGANFASVDSRVVYQASDEPFMQLGLTHLKAAGVTPDSVIAVGQRPGGEAHNIFDGGGRYLSLLGSNRWFHHPDDRWPTTIDLEKTERIVRAMLAMTVQLTTDS